MVIYTLGTFRKQGILKTLVLKRLNVSNLLSQKTRHTSRTDTPYVYIEICLSIAPYTSFRFHLEQVK